MAMKDIYATIRQSFRDILDARGIHQKTAAVDVAGPEIGDAGGLPRGAEAKLIAEFEGAAGECSTSYPTAFSGTLAEVAAMDIENNATERSIYIAVLNAVMNKYELADDCLTCREADKARCADDILHRYRRANGSVNFLLAGYQPHMVKALAEHFPLRVLDLDPANIGQEACGVTIEDGAAAYASAAAWAQVVLCTGSALTNGTIHDYIKLPKDVSFYGTTIAGVSRILNIRRLCPYGRN